jgi:hypothetical protein
MSEESTDNKKSGVLGGVEVHVKFTRYHEDFGIQLDFTPPKGNDGTLMGIEEINNALTGFCQKIVMEMDDEARLRLLALVEQDGGNDRVLYRLVVTTREADDGIPEIRIEDRIDPAFSRLDHGVAVRADRFRQEIERLLDEPPEGLRGESEEMFEVLGMTDHPPEIDEHTEDEVRQGLIEGQEFLLIEMQVKGSAEQHGGRESLALDYIAAMNPGALSSPWMKEQIRLLAKICEDTIMALGMTVARRLLAMVQRSGTHELCLYRLSVWYSMNDDGSPRYEIRDWIDPGFSRRDPGAGKRAGEARRLAAAIMEAGQKRDPAE